jgi:ribosome modulation factor
MSDINTKSEAYNTGFEAGFRGEPVNANPYPAGTVDAINWTAGWKDA